MSIYSEMLYKPAVSGGDIYKVLDQGPVDIVDVLVEGILDAIVVDEALFWQLQRLVELCTSRKSRPPVMQQSYARLSIAILSSPHSSSSGLVTAKLARTRL